MDKLTDFADWLRIYQMSMPSQTEPSLLLNSVPQTLQQSGCLFAKVLKLMSTTVKSLWDQSVKANVLKNDL